MPVVLTAPITCPSQLRSRRMKAAHAVSASRRATLVMRSDLGAWIAVASVAMSVPFNLRREAPSGRVVRVDGHGLRVGEQLANSRIGLARLRQDRLSHHAVLVEPAKREHPGLKHRRHLVDKFSCLFRAFRDEDRMTCAVRIGYVVADMIDQQHALADVAVGQADAAWEARLLGHGHPNDAALSQLVVRQAEQRTIRLGVQSNDAVGHSSAPDFLRFEYGIRSANISRVRKLALKPGREILKAWI